MVYMVEVGSFKIFLWDVFGSFECGCPNSPIHLAVLKYDRRELQCEQCEPEQEGTWTLRKGKDLRSLEVWRRGANRDWPVGRNILQQLTLS